MEQTKAIILHQPKTATVPGHSVITIVHMLLASCLHCFAFFFFFNLKESTSIRLLRNPSHSLSLYFFFFFFTTHTFGEREKTLRESVAADLSKIKPFLPPISLESQSVLNDFQNRR